MIKEKRLQGWWNKQRSERSLLPAESESGTGTGAEATESGTGSGTGADSAQSAKSAAGSGAEYGIHEWHLDVRASASADEAQAGDVSARLAAHVHALTADAHALAAAGACG